MHRSRPEYPSFDVGPMVLDMNASDQQAIRMIRRIEITCLSISIGSSLLLVVLLSLLMQ